jgi:type I restriction enzyme S subunit
LRTTDALDSRFLYNLVRSDFFIEQVTPQQTGTQYPATSDRVVRNQEIPLPNIDEQRAIASLIDHAEFSRLSAASHLASAHRAIDRFRQAVLAAACSGRLTADWRETQGNVDTDGDLPAGWRIVELQALAAEGAPIRYGIVKPGPEIAGGVPYIRQQDVIGGTVLVDQLAHTSAEIAERYRGSALREGDVLLGLIRNLRVAIVPPGLDGANITQGMVRIRPRPGVEGGYLKLYLESPAAQRWMHDRYVGLAMPRINVQDARSIPVPLPPEAEQAEILKQSTMILSVADEVAARVECAASAIDRTGQAVLAKAFRGELGLTTKGRHP